MADCGDKVLDLLNKRDDDLSKAEVSKVVKKLQSLKKKYNGDVGKMTAEVQQFLNSYRKARLREIQIKAQNAAMLQGDLSVFESSDLYKNNPKQFFEAKLTGIAGLAENSNNSVDLNYKVFKSRLSNTLINELDKEGLMPLFAGGTLDKEIMVEMFELRKGGKPGRSGSPQAASIAKVVNKMQNGKVKLLKNLGSSIEDLDGYIMRQTHSETAVGDVDFKEWSVDIRQELDSKKTFGEMDEAEIDDYLREKYNGIVDGSFSREFFTDEHPDLGTSRVFDSLDKRMSKSRAFHFTDGEAFHRYNEKYGMKNFAETIWFGMDKAARDAATLKVLGGSPAAYMNNLKASIGNKIKDNPEALKNLSEGWRDVEKLYDVAVRRIDRIPGRNLIAKTTRNLLSLNVASKLGGTVISSIPDTVTSIAALRSATGEGFLSGGAKLVSGFMSLIPKKNRKMWATKLDILSQDLIGGHFDKFGATNGMSPGLMQKAARNVMRYTGLEAQTEIGTMAVAKQFAIELGEFSKSPFSGLSDRVRANLQRYGVDDVDWKVMSRATEDIQGLRVMTPEAIRELPDSAFKEAFVTKKTGLVNSIDKYRQGLEDKLAQYLTDNADMGVPKSSSRERKMILQWTREDEPFGALLRLGTQFWTFPLSMGRIMSRVALSDPSKSARTVKELFDMKQLLSGQSGDLIGVAGTLSGLTVLGYMTYSAKQMIQGKSAPDPLDPKTVLHSMVQGGGAGLYGDFLTMLFQKQYGSAIVNALGPTIGEIDNVVSLFRKATEGKDIGAQTFRTLWRNTPGNNVWYARAALDYAIYYNMMEALNPGFKRKLERRVKKEPGFFADERKFFVKPSDVGI